MSLLEKEPWHLRKELSLGTIISLLALGAGSVMAWADMKAEVENKADKDTLTIVVQKQREFAEDIGEIKDIQDDILDEIKNLTVEIARERATREAQQDRN